MGYVLILYHSDSNYTANIADYLVEGAQSVENADLSVKTINGPMLEISVGESVWPIVILNIQWIAHVNKNLWKV